MQGDEAVHQRAQIPGNIGDYEHPNRHGKDTHQRIESNTQTQTQGLSELSGHAHSRNTRLSCCLKIPPSVKSQVFNLKYIILLR